MSRYDPLFEGNSPDEILKKISSMGVNIDTKADAKKPRRRQLTKNISIQTDIENEIVANESVKNWLFKEAPEIKPETKLQIENSFSFAQITEQKDPLSFDDGSYSDDPVLRELRNRMKMLKL